MKPPLFLCPTAFNMKKEFSLYGQPLFRKIFFRIFIG